MCAKTYRAAIYHGIGDVSIEEMPYPECGDNDIIVKNLRAGVCGSDISAYRHGGDANMIWKDHEFGHEMISEVVEIGSAVEGLKIGDHVFPNMGNAKRDLMRSATVGGFSEYIHIPQCEVGLSVLKVNKDIPLNVAVLLEPFCVGTKGARNVHPQPGESAIVFGAGIIGISAALMLKYWGLEQVMIVDISAYRLEKAEQFGLIPCNSAQEDLKEKAVEVFGKARVFMSDACGADCYIDALGLSVAIENFSALAKGGARLAVVGVHHEPITIANQLGLIYGNWVISGCGSGSYVNHAPEVLRMMESSEFDLTNLISHQYSQEDIIDALEMAGNPQEAQKVIITY
jgi:threonine dehydrogenase-like Zn-dependent dehydrogenase